MTRSHHYIRLACVSAAVVALLRVSGAAAAEDQKEFDYFVFVRQWAGSFCHTDASCPRVHRHGYHFTIHGLWPEYSDATWPQFCKKDEPFDESKLDGIMPELLEEWPSTQAENEGFWEHEWLKHGTCAESRVMPDELTYFSTILNLHHEFDLAGLLEARRIIPAAGKQYPTQDIIDAIRRGTGQEPKIHCDTKGELTEIWMCIGKDLRPMDCPKHETPRCDHVIIPPLSGSWKEEAGEEAEEEVSAQQGSTVSAVSAEEEATAQRGSSEGSAKDVGSAHGGAYALPGAPAILMAFIVALVLVATMVGFMFVQGSMRAETGDNEFVQLLLRDTEAQAPPTTH